MIHGVQHNTPFLRACLSNDKFLSGARPANPHFAPPLPDLTARAAQGT